MFLYIYIQHQLVNVQNQQGCLVAHGYLAQIIFITLWIHAESSLNMCHGGPVSGLNNS